ncbi:MAG: hypothetical protein ABI912_01465 [Actinomycetota bacterium]
MTFAALTVGLIVGGSVGGFYVLQQSTGAAARDRPAVASNVAAPALTVRPTTRPTPVPSVGESGKRRSDAYDGCSADASATGAEVQACVDTQEAYQSRIADPARDANLAINKPPAGCYRYDDEEPGVFSCSKEVTESRRIEQCHKARIALGLAPEPCGDEPGIFSSIPGATYSFEAHAIDQTDGDDLDPRTMPMRSPGFVVASDFTSGYDSDGVGLHWPGGVLELRLLGKNTRISLSVVDQTTGNPPRYSLPSDEPVQRQAVSPGDYMIWLDPADPRGQLAPYTLTVSAPQ